MSCRKFPPLSSMHVYYNGLAKPTWPKGPLRLTQLGAPKDMWHSWPMWDNNLLTQCFDVGTSGGIVFQWGEGKTNANSWSGFYEIAPNIEMKILIAHTWNQVVEKTILPLVSGTLKILSLEAICSIQSAIKCHVRCNIIRLKVQRICFPKNKVWYDITMLVYIWVQFNFIKSTIFLTKGAKMLDSRSSVSFFQFVKFDLDIKMTPNLSSLGAIHSIQSVIRCHIRCNVIRLKEQIIRFLENKVWFDITLPTCPELCVI